MASFADMEGVSENGAEWALPHGEPDGPEITVPYIGVTRTFLNPRKDLLATSTNAGIETIQHHVPRDMRGAYKLPSFPGELGEREGPAGFAMCTGETMGGTRNNPGDPRPCRSKAINRTGRCSRHGGMLHPLDRLRIDWEKAPREIRFKYGKLPVEYLDDEELSRGQIRKANGTFTDNKSVSIEIHDAMVRRLFERADTKLRENLLAAVDTMAEIATSTSVEPADRIRAATWIYERLRGKVPTEVKITQDKPFEVVLGAVLEGGSRAASRARRGIDDPEVPELESAIDAELVDLEDDGSYEVETIGYVDDPELRAEQVADAEQFVQEHVDPGTGPNVGSTGVPEDPALRDQMRLEQLKKDEEARAAIKAARAKRFAARAKGLDHVESYPYTIEEVADSPEDGPNATIIYWTEPKIPKMPASEEAKETRRRNRERWQ